jgi:hypothetical protein
MKERLRVSLSTDAVIYLPFYLAYFGGDFEDTPFGSVDVKIVGLNDPIFKYYDEELVKSENKNLEKAQEALKTANKKLDKSVVKGINHKNYVSRQKSRLALLVNSIEG